MSRQAAFRGAMVILIFGAVVCLGSAAWDSARMKRLDGAPAFRLPVDFSMAGVYRAAVHESFSGGCRRILRLQMTPGVNAGKELDAAMNGLEGDIVATDRYGREFYREDLWWSGPSWGGRGRLSQEMYPHERGTYVVTIHVRTPAAGMVGKRQEVVAEYDYCEAETLPIMAKGAAGLALGVVAGIILILRRESKRAARAESAYVPNQDRSG